MSVQNTSSAVMQQRIEPQSSLDDFPTPPWATRALCEWLADRQPLDMMTVREPAANRGHMAAPLSEYFEHVWPSDIHDYDMGFPITDYINPYPYSLASSDWTITNPPFKLAQEFIATALRHSSRGVAMLTRTSFLESVGRYNSLFTQTPPTHILQFSERVVMHKGKLSPKGSTATSYCWLIWVKSNPQIVSTQFEWIGPCRKKLEKPGDYEGCE